MNIDDKDEKSREMELEALRKEAYSDPEVTAVDGVNSGRELPLPIGRELVLDFIEGPKKGLKFIFPKGNVILGRSPDADLHIDDEKLSRKHAIVEAFSRDQIYISDLASTNGTFLNGMRVRSIMIKDGDELRLGSSVIKFTCRDTESK